MMFLPYVPRNMILPLKLLITYLTVDHLIQMLGLDMPEHVVSSFECARTVGTLLSKI